MGDNIREVVRESRFEHELRRLIREAIPADEFVEAAEYLLARDPLIGSPVTEDASVYFYYTFDESTVWLLSIAEV